jgi:hypothetical protein
MVRFYDTQKTGSDKIALLGLFIVALLIAGLITASKSAVVLSEPLELNYTGLSISTPVGNGWQSEGKWRSHENGFVLSSVFSPAAANPAALVRCRYQLTAADTATDELLKQRAEELKGTIAKTGQNRAAGLIIDWAHIKGISHLAPPRRWQVPEMPRTLFDVFYGTVALPDKHRLDIEVYQTTGDAGFAEKIFKGITGSLRFEDNELLRAGAETIAEIGSKGLSSSLNSRNQQVFFLVKDQQQHTIGFTADVTTDVGADSQLNIRSASLLYLRSGKEVAAFFQSNNSFDEFIWKSETSDNTGRTGIELTLAKTGVLTVKRYGPQDGEENYQLGPAAIPDALLDYLFVRMLEAGLEKLAADVIEYNGNITPILVSRITAESGYALKVELLDGRGFYEEVYLDDGKQILKRQLHHEIIYTFERTSSETVVSLFPERADYILQKNKMLNPDRLQN